VEAESSRGEAESRFGFVRWTSAHVGAAMRPRSSERMATEVEAHVAADRITWIGALVNVALTAFKLHAGLVCKSAAMISDAVHSASDLFSDFVTFVALRSSRLPADSDHPYGHERFETVGALVVGGVLSFAAWGLATNAIASLRAPAPDAGLPLVGRKLALVAAIVSILSKEALYRATVAVGKRVNSAALKANAWHHRSDALSSVVALVGIAASTVPGLAFADAVAGGVVAAMLGWIGLRVSVEAIAELTDTVDEVDLRAIRDKVVAIEGVREVATCRGRLVGGALVVDVELVANKDDLSASACRQIAERARIAILEDDTLLDDRRVKSATVTVIPAVKICPVVATMPSETDLANLVARTLHERFAAAPALFTHHDTIVRYEQLSPAIDVFLTPTRPTMTVKDLDRAATQVKRELARALGTCGRVNAIFWLSPTESLPPSPTSQAAFC